MKFKDLIDMALDRVDEDKEAPDQLALDVIKDGINQGYSLYSVLLDPKTKVFSYQYEKRTKLPDDFYDFVNVSHSVLGDLSDVDYERQADLICIHNRYIKNGTIDVLYIAYPEVLKNEQDDVILKGNFAHALSAYGAYAYQLHRRKYSAAQMLLQEFNSYLGITGGEQEIETE